MKFIAKICSFIFWLGLFSFSIADSTYTITKSGRKIQLDGFLLEWKKIDAKSFGSCVTGDIISTKEGLSGYFILNDSNNCFDSVLIYTAQSKDNPATFSLRDTMGNDNYKVNTGSENSKIIEWVLPWKSVLSEKENIYFGQIVFKNSKQNSSKDLYFQGEKVSSKKATLPAYIPKLILVAFLLLLFILYQLKLRQQKNRKVSPHQST